MPGPDRASRDHCFGRHEHVFHYDVIRTGATHAERVPVALDFYAFARHRNRKVDYLGTVIAVEDGARDEQVCAGTAADEALVCIHAVSAIDFDCLAVRRQPVVCPGTGYHEFVGCDFPERTGRFLVTPDMLEYVHADGVAVHCVRESGRAAVATDFANDGADVRMACATTAEFPGNTGREKAAALEVGIILRNKLASLVVRRRTSREGVSDITRDNGPVRGLVPHSDSFQFHDSLPE